MVMPTSGETAPSSPPRWVVIGGALVVLLVLLAVLARGGLFDGGSSSGDEVAPVVEEREDQVGIDADGAPLRGEGGSAVEPDTTTPTGDPDGPATTTAEESAPTTAVTSPVEAPSGGGGETGTGSDDGGATSSPAADPPAGDDPDDGAPTDPGGDEAPGPTQLLVGEGDARLDMTGSGWSGSGAVSVTGAAARTTVVSGDGARTIEGSGRVLVADGADVLAVDLVSSPGSWTVEFVPLADLVVLGPSTSASGQGTGSLAVDGAGRIVVETECGPAAVRVVVDGSAQTLGEAGEIDLPAGTVAVEIAAPCAWTVRS